MNLRIHTPTGQLARELALEQWEEAIASVIEPGMLPQDIATVACAVTVELMQGRIYFGRVHRNLFRDRAISCLSRTGNSEELARVFHVSDRHIRRIIHDRRKNGAR